MIKARDAIATARSLIGTPYSEMDCIALIRAIIKQAPGGVKDYRCQGTNWLWDSVNNSGKYRHLTRRWEGLSGAQAGMLAFKRYGMEDEGHVGLVTGEGTIIHSSGPGGKYKSVVETPLSIGEGWNLMGVHRYIETGETADEEEDESMQAYQARVVLREGNKPGNYLAVRSAPEGERIGRIEHGTVVTVQASDGEWAFVTRESGVSGYVHAQYLQRIEAEDEETAGVGGSLEIAPQAGSMAMVITDEDGHVFYPTGRISIEMRALAD